ncbi:glycoprotein 3-alpha-L-fucosyltransferase A-like [Littorina saxatilis]|uniref:Fucosyltransferase n=1 Tax=Littorina saxatilis TaxID=31220 RepID=A0AAN9B6J5_9CAEN
MRCHPRRALQYVLGIWLLCSGAFYYWTQIRPKSVSDYDNTEKLENPIAPLEDSSNDKQPHAKAAESQLRLVKPSARSAQDSELGKEPRDPSDDQGFALPKKAALVEATGPLIYPSLEHYSDDRIPQQMKFVAPSIRKKMQQGEKVGVKKICTYPFIGDWSIQESGGALFKKHQCAVQACEIVGDDSLAEADVVLTKGSYLEPSKRPEGQVWALFLLESPYHTAELPDGRLGLFNWTATYRHDSTIVAPYEKYVPFNASVLSRPPAKNYALGKTKKVAWFVSNCGAQNGRLQYARELAQHIQVDIYGGCGDLTCPRHEQSRCFQMLDTDYKFYLAFENSNCRDYITEKFFINGLQHDVIPIVMGAHPDDYLRASPPNSFIHVDHFDSPKHLAAYLTKLDQDDRLFNQYFTWKGLWTNINTIFWCRVCQLAHDIEARGPSWFEDINKWWRGPGVCTNKHHWWPLNATQPVIGDIAVQPDNT